MPAPEIMHQLIRRFSENRKRPSGVSVVRANGGGFSIVEGGKLLIFGKLLQSL
jgi:hypothetical protein